MLRPALVGSALVLSFASCNKPEGAVRSDPPAASGASGAVAAPGSGSAASPSPAGVGATAPQAPASAGATAPSAPAATVATAAPSGAGSSKGALGAKALAPSASASGAAAASAAPPSAPLGSPVRFQKATALYQIDATPPPSCKAGAPCEVVVRLEAKAPYHINKEYPYKLKAEGTGATLANADGVFSKQSGDFSQQGESLGLLKVRFSAPAAGQAKVRGVYKFSVCSESDCKLDQAEVAFETPIQ